MNILTKKEPQTATPRRTILPRYDVREEADAFTVTIDLPGVERSAVETAVENETLTIFGRRAWTPPAEWTPLHRESAVADYRLTLELNRRVNHEAIRAELSQGVLTLTLPKAEAVKPRKIEISG